MHGLRSPSLALIAALAVPAFASAQDAPTGARSFVLEAGSHELEAFLSDAAAYLDWNILWDPTEFAAAAPKPIKIRKTIKVDDSGCLELLNTLLHHRQMAILPRNEPLGIYEVVSMSGQHRGEISAHAKAITLDELERYERLAATQILLPIALENNNATLVTNALRPFFAQVSGSSLGLQIGSSGEQRSLLLQGFGPQVAAAVRLIRRVDEARKGDSNRSQVVSLEHASAAEVAATLRQLSPQPAQGYGPTLNVAHHDSTNSLVLSGPSSMVDESIELIGRLDKPSAAVTPSLEARIAELEKQVEVLRRALADRDEGKH